MKVALLAAAIASLLVVAARVMLGQFELVDLAVFPLVFGAAYTAALAILGRRIALARTVLKEIRHHRFENLEAAHLPRGDELNDLVWQVYRTGQVLEREMGELRQAENYRKEFLGNVSHELKTPIFAIRGFAETLRDGAVDDVVVNRSFLEKIMRNADRLSTLVRDLGEISRIETGELTMDIGAFDMGVMIGEIVESMEPIARAKEIALRTVVPANLPLVMGDQDHIRQVVVNLVDNGVKYNNRGGLVEIVLRAVPDGRVRISVVDNGIGVDDEHLPRITERFYRVDKSRSRSQGGTGLGLAIVKHILAAHDTHLLIESRSGGGSTFGFALRTAD